MNEPDSYALEEALRLKEKHGGEVIALSLGPERVKQTIKEALAKGADRGIHIADDNFAQLDPLGTAKVIAAAIAKEKVDLVLTGLQSDDHGFGQTGVLLAALLNLPHATLIMQIDVQDAKMKLKRELEAGWFQWIECPLPAVLTIQSGINKVRYATLKGIMAAKKKRLPLSPAKPSASPSNRRKELKNLRPHQNQENGIPHRYAEGSRGQAGRKTQVRSAGTVAPASCRPAFRKKSRLIMKFWSSASNAKANGTTPALKPSWPPNKSPQPLQPPSAPPSSARRRSARRRPRN